MVETPYQASGSFGYIQIGKLLERVRQAGGVIPAKYFMHEGHDQNQVRAERLRLGRNISRAFMWYDIYPRLTQKGTVNKRLKALIRIEARIAAVLRELDENQLMSAISPQIRRNTDDGASYHEIVDGMEALRDTVGALARGTGDPEPLLQRDQTPKAVLLGRLAKVYSQDMCMEPLDGLGRNYHDLSGPFPEFLRSAYNLRGLKEPTNAGLEKALERAGII